MSVCRHFLVGKCRFGDRCRFSHQTPTVTSKECEHCHVQIQGTGKFCPNCTPHAKGRNIVRSSNDKVCCDECKEYYCIKHTSRLFAGSTYHQDVIYKKCREKSFYCEHRTREKPNKKIEGKDCSNYFCKTHNWDHVKNLKLEATKSVKNHYRLTCKECVESYCPSCHPDKAREVKNIFRCSKCTYLYGCKLDSHGEYNQGECTCDRRRFEILGIRYPNLSSDRIHPDYEVVTTPTI